MTLIVNLSTTHDYSINETVAAFVDLCDRHSKGCLSCMPGFFQSWTNQAWVMAKYKLNYSSLIEPYKLGKITTQEFLDNLSKIFYFMKDIDKNKRELLLANAWNASIKLSENTQDRLSHLVEEAKTQPVYLISNTNELNVKAILDLFKVNNPGLRFKENPDIGIVDAKKPIEILPNVYLCLSYRFGAFKEETPSTASLIEDLTSNLSDPITLVSQFSGDLSTAERLGLSTLKAEAFYKTDLSDDNAMKKTL